MAAHRPQAVIFDLDNTLYADAQGTKEAFDTVCRYVVDRTASASALDPVRLEQAVRREAQRLYPAIDGHDFASNIEVTEIEALWARFDEGNDPRFRLLEQAAPAYRRAVWSAALQTLGAADETLGHDAADRFFAERRRHHGVYDDTFRLLDALRGRFRLLLLTNGAVDLQAEKIAAIPGLTDYFPYIVISGEFGEGKPSAAIFRHALGLLGVQPQDALMVGDNVSTDIEGARRSGIPSVWLSHSASIAGAVKPDYEISRLGELETVLGL